MVKMTFTLDRETVEQLRRAASRLTRPQSFVVREAIREYSSRIGRLSNNERINILKVFDQVVPAIPERSLQQLKDELAEIRKSRRRGGRKHLIK
jgi:hypothetical protein